MSVAAGRREPATGALDRAGRVVGVDVARAVALIAMMGTHLLPEYDDAGHITPFFWFAAGRASALFALLAGVGLALATGGQQTRLAPLRGTVARVVVRALLVAGIGLALVALDPPIAVILTNYGLLFLLALPLLGLRPRTLLLLAAGWVVALPLLSQAWRMHLPAGPGEQLGFGDLADPVSLLTRLALTGYYPVLTWLAYLMVGLAVGRMRLHERAVALRLLVAGTALALAAWLVSAVLVGTGGWRALTSAGPDDVVWPAFGATQLELRGLYGTTPTTSWWWLAVVSPHSGTPFDLAQTIGSALAVLGLSLLAVRATTRATGFGSWLPRGLVESLACAGSMTLTLYSVHVVAADAQRDVAERTALLMSHIGVALLFAVLWRTWRRRGPLEQVVHWASHAAGRAISR